MLNQSTITVVLWKFVLLSALTVEPSSLRRVSFDRTRQLSHFKGVIGSTDARCFNLIIEKKTQLPLSVPVVTNLPLSAIKATASEFSKIGFTMDIPVGGLGAKTTILKFHGSEKTKYAIEVECYCTAAAPPPPEVEPSAPAAAV